MPNSTNFNIDPCTSFDLGINANMSEVQQFNALKAWAVDSTLTCFRLSMLSADEKLNHLINIVPNALTRAIVGREVKLIDADAYRSVYPKHIYK